MCFDIFMNIRFLEYLVLCCIILKLLIFIYVIFNYSFRDYNQTYFVYNITQTGQLCFSNTFASLTFWCNFIVHK